MLDDGWSRCKELLFREVCSFHRAVAEQFGTVEATKAVNDWIDLLGEAADGQTDVTLPARRATVFSADRLASRICEDQSSFQRIPSE